DRGEVDRESLLESGDEHERERQEKKQRQEREGGTDQQPACERGFGCFASDKRRRENGGGHGVRPNERRRAAPRRGTAGCLRVQRSGASRERGGTRLTPAHPGG